MRCNKFGDRLLFLFSFRRRRRRGPRQEKGDSDPVESPFVNALIVTIVVLLFRLLERAAVRAPVNAESCVFLHAEAAAMLTPAREVLDFDLKTGDAVAFGAFGFFFFSHLVISPLLP